MGEQPDRIRPVPYGPNRRRWTQQVPEIARPNGSLLIAPPQTDPNDVYEDNDPVGIEATDLQVPPRGLSSHERRRALARIETYEEDQDTTYLGHQNHINKGEVDYRKALAEYLNTMLNNVGDPFVAGSLSKNTKFAERAVLDYYASLWNANWPSRSSDPESYWGYVLSMGSTEGNLYSILQGRDYLKGRPLYEGGQAEPDRRLASDCADVDQVIDNPNAYRPVAFFSGDRHYSIFKALRTMEIATPADIGTSEYPGQCPITPDGTWHHNVPSEPGDTEHPVGTGRIDIDKLATLVEFFAARGHPIMLVLTVGTTFKGAYDPVDAVGERLLPIFQRYGLAQRCVWPDRDDPDNWDWRTGFWVHVDGALAASYLPFIEMAYHNDLIDRHAPIFDFRLPFVHSIVVSGHKWIGTPWPTGIYMTRRKFLIQPPEDPDYIGAPDTTFAGSRNGLSPLILWYYTAVMSYDLQVERVMHCLNVAAYAEDRLRHLSSKLGVELWVQRSPLSLSVLFRKPNDKICSTYSLSTEAVYDPNLPDAIRTYAHIYCMGSVTHEMIDRLIGELEREDAFPDAKPDATPRQRCGENDERPNLPPHGEELDIFRRQLPDLPETAP